MGRKHGATRRRQKASQPARRRRTRLYSESVAQHLEDERATRQVRSWAYVPGRDRQEGGEQP